MDRFRSGPSFQVHVPCHPHGTDPSRQNREAGQPNPVRQTVRFSWITRGNGRGLVGRMSSALTAATAEITCTQANVEPGNHFIRVGAHELLPAVDFEVGGDDNTLAANLAAALSLRPGLTASAVNNVVTVETLFGHGDDVRMEILETGTASAFALSTLERDGFLDRGSPAPTAPEIS